MLSKTLTIMFVDLRGYASLTSQKTREEHQLFVQEIHASVEKHAQSTRGTLVKTMGDGFLITFKSPTDAIHCGLAIQEETGRRNMNILDESHWLRLRVGISTGKVSIDEKGDVYGKAVNIAAQIEKRCDPNEVFISESTYLAMNRPEVNAPDLGPLKFKNVTEDVRVFKILRKKRGVSGSFPGFRPRLPAKGWMIGTAVAVLAVAGILFFENRAEKSFEPSAPPEDALSSDNPMELCRENIERYCGNVQPGGGRIMHCLMEHFGSLDPACAGVFPQEETARATAMDVLSSCDEDIRNYCAAVQYGDGRIIRCLKEHDGQLSRTCRKSLPKDI